VAVKKQSSSPQGKPKNVVAAARGRKPAARTGDGWWETFKSIAGMIAIFLAVRQFLVEAYRIPSPSMVPSLLVGDWLFVNKLRYGPHVPFTDVNLPGYAEPRRGEVVVFVSPPQIDNGEDSTPTLVKRLVGMPGDTLHMRGGLLHVNGIAQRQGYGAPAVDSLAGAETNPLYVWQQQYALRRSRFGAAPASPTHDDWGPIAVPAGHYFMLGDNRYNSKDSRYWGVVPRENIRGRPLFVYYSYVPECRSPLSGILCIRWTRIGDWIR
jgi:signal peptidase I